MADETVAPIRVVENRQEWFCMLTSYMKMRTLALWLHYYPDTSYEAFDAIWPYLLDQMLTNATSAAVKKLLETVERNQN